LFIDYNTCYSFVTDALIVVSMAYMLLQKAVEAYWFE